jgi:hypothetical protein
MVRGLDEEKRAALDAAIFSRPGRVDEDTGLVAPSWWKGEEDAAASAAAFMGIRRN